MQHRMRNAKLVNNEARATGNYSYTSSRMRGDRHIMVGDAYAFVDPVFSSGVYLAMNSAFVGAELVEARLSNPARVRAAAKRFDRVMIKGPREFSWFIYRVTNPTMRDLFMEPRNVLRVKEALLSLFAGDIFGKTPIWPSIFVFKSLYRVISLFNTRRTLDAVRRRRENIRDVESSETAAQSHDAPRVAA